MQRTTHSVLLGLTLGLALLAGCRRNPPGESVAPVPPATPRNTQLPAGWPLPLPPGARVRAVNWGEPTPGRDRVQITAPGSVTDLLAFYEGVFRARGMTADRQHGEGNTFLSAGGAGQRFDVEAWGEASGSAAMLGWRH